MLDFSGSLAGPVGVTVDVMGVAAWPAGHRVKYGAMFVLVTTRFRVLLANKRLLAITY